MCQRASLTDCRFTHPAYFPLAGRHLSGLSPNTTGQKHNPLPPLARLSLPGFGLAPDLWRASHRFSPTPTELCTRETLPLSSGTHPSDRSSARNELSRKDGPYSEPVRPHACTINGSWTSQSLMYSICYLQPSECPSNVVFYGLHPYFSIASELRYKSDTI